MEETPRLRLLKTFAMSVLLIGAAVSLVLVIQAGHKNHSFILPALFVIWVLSPYAGLIFTTRASKIWPARSGAILYSLIIVIAICSLAGYSGLLSPAGAKPAGVFLIIPLLSWVTMAIAIPFLRSRKVK